MRKGFYWDFGVEKGERLKALSDRTRAPPRLVLIDALTFLSFTHHRLSLTSLRRVYDQSCPLNPLHLPHIPTLRPSLTLPWTPTDERRRKTWPRIPSFPPYNPAVPPKLSSPSFENNFPGLANLKMVTTDSQNGSPRL